jgi:dTDP-4-amino-4,6-dideoxygalactose transaminase
MTPHSVGVGSARAPATPPLVVSPERVGTAPRIHLSVPHMGGAEERYVREAIATNWLSTVGPQHRRIRGRILAPDRAPGGGGLERDRRAASGSSLLGVGPGDEVLSPTLTFVASVNPIALPRRHAGVSRQ